MSSSDFFRNFQPLFESKDVDMEEKVTKAEDKRKADKEDAAVKALDKDKKANNVKETAGAFFRKYADIIAEAEEPLRSADREDDDDDTNSDEEDDLTEGNDVPGYADWFNANQKKKDVKSANKKNSKDAQKAKIDSVKKKESK